ncbi:hypothetical protein [Parasphingorhabdus cellanae]|uniref:Uncharacterized protein n=1 Tax=Parasphingorhabdus cellanae TaxID=2806553 RepID=A0ABX7T0I6_9SPHN|nr:hypothetical protein [Parasphingorhabdus cellanae]QTD55058.1 hypothetical protein J4G78_12580 [Parasphingorhabdus cellanae]
MLEYWKKVAICLWAVPSLFVAAPALAASVVFPGDGAVGLEPPGDMTVAESFSGFRDSEEGASILIAEFPLEAYAQIAPQFTPEKLASRMTMDGPAQKLTLAGDVEALLAVGVQTQQGFDYRKWVMIARSSDSTAMVTVQIPATSEAYSDDEVLSALQSVRFQPRGSLEDEIARLPFTVAERADFRAVRTLAGSGLLMTDGPEDVVSDGSQPLVIIASSIGTNPAVGALTPEQRKTLALKAMQGLDFKDLQTDAAEVEEDGDVVIAGKGTDDAGREMIVRQIMRFSPTSHIRTVCVFKAEQDIAGRCDKVGQAVVLKAGRNSGAVEE